MHVSKLTPKDTRKITQKVERSKHDFTTTGLTQRIMRKLGNKYSILTTVRSVPSSMIQARYATRLQIQFQHKIFACSVYLLLAT